MTQDEFLYGIVRMPDFMGMPVDALSDSLKAKMSMAIDRIVVRYPFRFATASAVVSGGSVADQAAYECPGKNSEALEIHSVRYGAADTRASLKLLDKMTPRESEEDGSRRRSLDDDGTATESSYVDSWVRVDDAEPGRPRIELVGTPGVADYVIRYRYARRGVAFKEFPSEWLYVLQSSLLACMGDFAVASGGFLIPRDTTAKFEVDIGDMIDFYDKKSGNPSPAPMGKAHRNRNIIRNTKHGY